MNDYKILKNCSQLLTVTEEADDLIGFSKNNSILIKDERIEAIGPLNLIIEKYEKELLMGKVTEIDCSSHVVMPGFVDSHTHLVFGESRVEEYSAGLTKTPEEVKKFVKRVGLESSIFSTVNATEHELLRSSLDKLERMLKSGTTTVEIKSGYGIDKNTELKQLRLIRHLEEYTPQTILSTYLGAHYYDKSMGKEKYLDYMIQYVMPIISDGNLADFCDIWVDSGYYTAEDARKLLSAGIKYGMKPSLHSECYSDIGGAKVAAELKAANAGHLNYLTIDGAKLLAQNNVVGILLPGTDFSVKHPKPFEPKFMLDAGMTLAIATNLNPGNWIESIPIAMTLACRNHGMSVEEAIRSTTLNGAKALGIEEDFGSIEIGKFADIQILKSDNYKNVVYKFGVNELEMVLKKGSVVFNSKM